MSLFRRTPEPLPGDDAPVSDHLDAIAADRPGAVAGFVRALAARPLFLAAAELPPGVGIGPTVTQRDLPVRLLTATLPGSEGVALLVFTEVEGVTSRAPGSFPMEMPGRDALGLAVRSHDGIVVNPHAHWQALPSAWIADALG